MNPAARRPVPSHTLTPQEIERCNVIASEIEQSHVDDYRVGMIPVHEAAMQKEVRKFKGKTFTCASDVRPMFSRDVRFLRRGFAGYVGYSEAQIVWHNAERRQGK